MKINHEIVSTEHQDTMQVDFWIDTCMGRLYFRPLLLNPAFMSPAEREAKVNDKAVRIRNRLQAYMENPQ